MADFPIFVFFRRIDSMAALKAALREDAKNGPARRQDGHAAEVWLEAIEADSAAAALVGDAAVEMVAEECDPAALDMVLILGTRAGERFYRAAAIRALEGPPFEDPAGTLMHRAMAVGDAELRARLYDKASAADRLRMSLNWRTAGIAKDFAAAAAAGTATAALAGRTATVLASAFPDSLAAAARSAAGLPDPIRRSFLEDAADIAPNRRSELAAILGLA